MHCANNMTMTSTTLQAIRAMLPFHTSNHESRMHPLPVALAMDAMDAK
jgi:hypothetical protein